MWKFYCLLILTLLSISVSAYSQSEKYIVGVIKHSEQQGNKYLKLFLNSSESKHDVEIWCSADRTDVYKSDKKVDWNDLVVGQKIKVFGEWIVQEGEKMYWADRINMLNEKSVEDTQNKKIYSLGDPVIDLGSYGLLIFPVLVDGKWYYYWDRSGDGTSKGQDGATHDELDKIFCKNIIGIPNTKDKNADGFYGTTNTYRYATLNGVDLALPTHGEATVAKTIKRPSTTIDNNPVGEINSAYDDLLAIWDAHEGTLDDSFPPNGQPLGWNGYQYWSATPHGAGHVLVSLYIGNAIDEKDVYNFNVALQVY